jgi:hypothetical protein
MEDRGRSARRVGMKPEKLGDYHPYLVLGALLAEELDSPPPRFSRKRKRLRAAMRLRLAHLATEAERPRSQAPHGEGPAAA